MGEMAKMDREVKEVKEKLCCKHVLYVREIILS